MTKDQIKKCLADIGGYGFDTWLSLKEVTFILTNQEARFAINPLYRYNFGSDGIFRIVKGKERLDGTFVTDDGEVDSRNFKPITWTSFNMIHGFVQTCDRSQCPILPLPRKTFS